MRWILFVLMCVGSQVWGQVEFAPVGAKWTLERRDPVPPSRPLELKVVSETEFEGKIVKNLVRDYHPQDTTTLNPSVFFYQTGDSIYVTDPTLTDATLIYDFSLAAGDTLVIDEYLSYRVDSIGTMTVNGFELKLQYVALKCYFEDNFSHTAVKFVESIGAISIEGGWFANFFFFSNYCLLDASNFEVRCYEDDEIGFYQVIDDGEDCFITTATENITETEHQIKVSPNPVQEHIQLTFSEALHHQELDIEVFSTQGVSVLKTRKMKGEASINLDIGQLPKGIYFIQSQTDHGFMQTIKVVKSSS